MNLACAKRFAAALAMLSIALAPVPALAAEEESGAERAAAIALDLAILRPAGFVRFVFGSAISVAILPFVLTSGQGKEMLQQLAGDPAAYTFKRKLGDF